jgi:hypothetical protein
MVMVMMEVHVKSAVQQRRQAIQLNDEVEVNSVYVLDRMNNE